MEHAGNVLSVSLPERAAGVLPLNQRNIHTYGSDFNLTNSVIFSL